MTFQKINHYFYINARKQDENNLFKTVRVSVKSLLNFLGAQNQTKNDDDDFQEFPCLSDRLRFSKFSLICVIIYSFYAEGYYFEDMFSVTVPEQNMWEKIISRPLHTFWHQTAIIIHFSFTLRDTRNTLTLL
jgi:hypothetical protein